MDKKNEILFKQKRQNDLKNEVRKLRNQLPKLIIGSIFFVVVSLYFLEDKFYHFFGNTVNFIFGTIILLCVFCLSFILKNYIKIYKKEKKIKEIGVQLYKLNRLEDDTLKK